MCAMITVGAVADSVSFAQRGSSLDGGDKERDENVTANGNISHKPSKNAKCAIVPEGEEKEPATIAQYMVVSFDTLSSAAIIFDVY